ncbi:hypothetical protein PAXRUDRAFT_185668 [Paxillus rubicundulus Ve08.2h10]|uniref:Uncharacterized protein n=1 Tax=Paxillus rubicundulus Ve08.2h10 TaxID=930991 RepID=A0A0D0DYT1_9AGAM|nr:hypothetical protein PAXRUDRAFT_185668 [Paxillus rubicundulus Ve08.2h10]
MRIPHVLSMIDHWAKLHHKRSHAHLDRTTRLSNDTRLISSTPGTRVRQVCVPTTASRLPKFSSACFYRENNSTGVFSRVLSSWGISSPLDHFEHRCLFIPETE